MNEEEFYRGTKWKWMPEDSDIWFYKTGQVVQSIGGELTGFSARIICIFVVLKQRRNGNSIFLGL
jgi:hypothetical protein